MSIFSNKELSKGKSRLDALVKRMDFNILKFLYI